MFKWNYEKLINKYEIYGLTALTLARPHDKILGAGGSEHKSLCFHEKLFMGDRTHDVTNVLRCGEFISDVKLPIHWRFHVYFAHVAWITRTSCSSMFCHGAWTSTKSCLVQWHDTPCTWCYAWTSIYIVVSMWHHASVNFSYPNTLSAEPAGDDTHLMNMCARICATTSLIKPLDAHCQDVFTHVSFASFEPLAAHKSQNEWALRLLCHMSKKTRPGES